MVPQILIHTDPAKRQEVAEKVLSDNQLSPHHPNVLWLGEATTLGVEQAKKVRSHLAIKPYQGDKQAVVIIYAENLTAAAQNSLLKTMEELPSGSLFVLGAPSDDHLLPTIISRSQVINLKNQPGQIEKNKYKEEINQLLQSSFEERFQFVEKLEEKEQFLTSLTGYFHSKLRENPAQADLLLTSFLKDLVKAEKWARQNVNIRAILEYLMLKMPRSTLSNR